MDWSKGYSARYQMTEVDPVTWRDIDTLRFTGGKIDRSADGLKESADIDMTDDPGEKWIRIYLDARQNGTAFRTAIFTGLTSTPKKEMEGRRNSYSVACYSVLKPCDDILMSRGWYAPAGSDGAKLIAKLLKVIAPVRYSGQKTIINTIDYITDENGETLTTETDQPLGIITSAVTGGDIVSPKLSTAIIAEDGETRLTMAQKIADAINWNIRITGMGEIDIEPYNTEIKAVFSPDADMIEPKLSVENDWYSCPNVFRAIMDGMAAVARDDSADSRLSTISRGREIWQEETDCDLSGSETLSAYAIRRLKELQNPSKKVSYDRRYNPDVAIGSYVRLNYPQISGTVKVTSQSVTLGYACTTAEEGEMVE